MLLFRFPGNTMINLMFGLLLKVKRDSRSLP